MEATTYSSARAHLASLMDRVCDAERLYAALEEENQGKTVERELLP